MWVICLFWNFYCLLLSDSSWVFRFPIECTYMIYIPTWRIQTRCLHSESCPGSRGWQYKLRICILNPPFFEYSSLTFGLVSLIQRIHSWSSAGVGERQLPRCLRRAEELRDLTSSYNQSFLFSPHRSPLLGYLVPSLPGCGADTSVEIRFILSLPPLLTYQSFPGLQSQFPLDRLLSCFKILVVMVIFIL